MKALFQNRKRLAGIIFAVIYLIVLGILFWSVILSGYNFQINIDELYHVNIVYVIAKGMKPYKDFYSTYSPFLHWLLLPLLKLSGFNITALYLSRLFMVTLFCVRIILMFLLVKKVFGKLVAFIFLPLALMDPFTVFAAMQIRPENLMMVIYTFFLLIFSYTYQKKSVKLHFLSGVFFALTFLANLKILPSLFAFGLVFIIYYVYKRYFHLLLGFINGFCLTCIAFFLYCLINNYGSEMFLQLFLDPIKLNNSILNATWLGYFYFSNIVIYGLDGKPLNWIYAWALPIMAFAGGYHAFIQATGNGPEKSQQFMKIVLFFSLILQWLSMLFITSVFIQYYIPLSWLYAVFTAVLLHDLVFKVKLPTFINKSLTILFIVIFFFLCKTSIEANINRSKMNSDQLAINIKAMWKKIPEDEYVFPNFIFRPPVYPILYGGTFSSYIRDRYPPAYKALENYKVKMLVDLSDEYFSFLDPDTQSYILAHYKREQGDGNIWYLQNKK